MIEKIKGTNSYRINFGFSPEAFQQAKQFDPTIGILYNEEGQKVFEVALDENNVNSIGKYGVSGNAQHVVFEMSGNEIVDLAILASAQEGIKAVKEDLVEVIKLLKEFKETVKEV